MGTYFGTDFEQNSIDAGISRQQHETGFVVKWWFWDPKNSETDPIYDEPIPGRSMQWRGPFPMPFYEITRTEGAAINQGDGGYTIDSLTAVLGFRQATDAGLTPAVDETAQHLKDRFVWDGKVWTPSSIVARNLLGGRGTRSTIILAASQVRDDELVNDPNFQRYSEPDYVDPNPGFVPR